MKPFYLRETNCYVQTAGAREKTILMMSYSGSRNEETVRVREGDNKKEGKRERERLSMGERE